jgi:hypothetical protein
MNKQTNINGLENNSKGISPRIRWTPNAVKQLREMVTEGQRPREIAKVFGGSFRGIHRKMQKLGLRVFGPVSSASGYVAIAHHRRGRPRKTDGLEHNSKGIIPRIRWTPKAVEQLREMVANGQRPREIAKVFGGSFRGIRNKMHMLGLRVCGPISSALDDGAVASRRRGRPGKAKEPVSQAFHRHLPTQIDIYTRARDIFFRNLLTRASASPAEEWREAEMETAAAFFEQCQPAK